MEAKLKHLEFVQNIISRMATNSFLLKGWSVLLTASLLALSAPDSNRRFALLAYAPLVVLWMLDAYFLAQERSFRSLFRLVAGSSSSEVDFTLEAEDLRFADWWKSAISKTILPFYGVQAISIVVVAALLS